MQENYIRNQPLAEVIPQANVINQVALTTEPRVKRRSSRKSVSASSIASYLGVFLLIVALVAISYQPPKKQTSLAAVNQTSEAAAGNTVASSSVDQLLATNVGANLADTTGLPVANNVANLSQSLATESTLAQTTTDIVSKPQNVALAANNRVIKQYVTVAGDTVPAVAAKYGITGQTVRWANSLTSDALEPGKTLTILPVDGILYTVKSGDTIESIASKYQADVDVMIHYGDLEAGLTVGQQITIPGAVLPANEQPGYVAPRTATTSYYTSGAGTSTSSNLSASVGNRYAWGNCTWYAYERRQQLGRPVGSFWGNASTWSYNARSAGYAVSGTPAAGDVMANGGGYGHVSIVESVNPGVSIHVSEMNGYRWGGGFNRVGSGDISWSEAVSGMYQYIH